MTGTLVVLVGLVLTELADKAITQARIHYDRALAEALAIRDIRE